jgi:hypothetical protein
MMLPTSPMTLLTCRKSRNFCQSLRAGNYAAEPNRTIARDPALRLGLKPLETT